MDVSIYTKLLRLLKYRKWIQISSMTNLPILILECFSGFKQMSWGFLETLAMSCRKVVSFTTKNNLFLHQLFKWAFYGHKVILDHFISLCYFLGWWLFIIVPTILYVQSILRWWTSFWKSTFYNVVMVRKLFLSSHPTSAT